MPPREMNPLNHFSDLRHEMDRLLDSFVGGVNRGLPFRFRTEQPVNLYEDADRLYAEIEVPGVNMTDIEVHVADNDLTVKGNRPEPATEDMTFHRRERGAGAFVRVVDLPVEVNADKVEAVLKSGVLTVTLPKAESGKARRINIKGE